jgi:hypothetical protein
MWLNLTRRTLKLFSTNRGQKSCYSLEVHCTAAVDFRLDRTFHLSCTANWAAQLAAVQYILRGTELRFGWPTRVTVATARACAACATVDSRQSIGTLCGGYVSASGPPARSFTLGEAQVWSLADLSWLVLASSARLCFHLIQASACECSSLRVLYAAASFIFM